MAVFKWSEAQIAFLIEHYEKKGKMFCVEQLGLKEHQVRYKASALGLKSRGKSEAWHQKNREHAKKLTGRKRPQQAEVMKNAIHTRGLHIADEARRAALSKMVKERFGKNHPRGMLGKKHSDEARQKMREAQKRIRSERTPEQYGEMITKGMKTKLKNGTLYQPRKASWKQAWATVGEQRCFFRSQWEANYARYLQFLQQQGAIKKWEHEPVTFWFENIKRGTRSYLPDFRVTENDGSVVYHEVKGWMDARSQTKLKRMAKYYPDVKLVLIRKKEYKEIQNKLSGVIDGWEM